MGFLILKWQGVWSIKIGGYCSVLRDGGKMCTFFFGYGSGLEFVENFCTDDLKSLRDFNIQGVIKITIL